MTTKPAIPLDTRIVDLDVPLRMKNALALAGCMTLADALAIPDRELKRLPQVGDNLIWGWRGFLICHGLNEQPELADAS